MADGTVPSCVADAEQALLVSKQCQQNGLLPEAVMSTIEALEYIHRGLEGPSLTTDQKDHLENLNVKANCLLDVLARMSSHKAEEEALQEHLALIDLMAVDDAGLQEVYRTRAANYSQFDSSQTLIYSSDDAIWTTILKVTRPRLIYFLQVMNDVGDKLYTVPLRDKVQIHMDRNKQEVQLPHFSEGFVKFTLASADLERLIEVLDEHLIPYNCIEKDEVAAAAGPSADTYPHGLVRGATVVSSGIKRGAEKTGEFISWSTPYIISKLAKSNSVEVSDNWRTTANIAKSTTNCAASVTGRVAEKLGNATMAIGRFLAPHAQATGSRLLVHTTGASEEDASEKVNSVLNFTAGAVTAVATVFEGIEEGVKVIGSSIGENSGKIIEHKYGPEAASVAADTFETIGNVYSISKNRHILKPKSLIKSTVKNAGKGLLMGNVEPSTSQENLRRESESDRNGIEESPSTNIPPIEESSSQPGEGSSNSK